MRAYAFFFFWDLVSFQDLIRDPPPKAFGLSSGVHCLAARVSSIRMQQLPVTIYMHTHGADRAYLWIIWWNLCQTAENLTVREDDGIQTSHELRVRTWVVLLISKSETEAEQDFGIKCDNCFHYRNFIQLNDNNEIIENGTYIHVFSSKWICILIMQSKICQRIDKLYFQLTIHIFTQRIIGKKEKKIRYNIFSERYVYFVCCSTPEMKDRRWKM